MFFSLKQGFVRNNVIFLMTVYCIPQSNNCSTVEPQSLVVLGCTALLTMVGAIASTHDREEGWEHFLHICVERIEQLAGFEPTTLQNGLVIPEKKNTTQTTQPQAILNDQRTNRVLYQQTSGSHMKKCCGDLNLQHLHLQSAMLSTQIVGLVIYKVT